ncbi:MAG: peptide ABC transporter substrate-binding protein [Chloroflexota bacterium]
MRLNRKPQWLIGMLMILALVLSACPAPAGSPATGGESGSEEMAGDSATDTLAGRDPNTLVILYWQAASLPGPYLSGGTKDQDAGAITLEPLANMNPDGVLVPKLATEIPTIENGGVAEDLTSITWNLKEGVKWSDGSDFSAADVVFTWEYCADPDTGCTSSEAFIGIESVEAVDDLTVLITFEGPTPYPYNAFVGAQTPIISSAQFADCVGAAAQTCNDQNIAPLGTGPYKVVEFKVNDVVTYERNEFWHGGEAPFEKVTFKGGGDAVGSARAVLETGEADMGWNLQVEPEILAEMEGEDALGTIEAAFAGSVERILINQTNPDPDLGDLRAEYDDGNNPHPFLVGTVIPQAMSMAIDRGLIAGQLYGFAGKATCNIIPAPVAAASTANDACLAQDIEGANALLDEAGIMDTNDDGIREYEGMPLVVRYQTSTNSVRQKTQALIKQWWAEIGVETELLNHDAGVFFGGDPNSPDTYQKFFTDIQMYTTGPGIDAQLHLSNWLCSQIPGKENVWGGGNIHRGCSEEFDTMYDELVTTPAGDARNDVIKAMNDVIVQNYYLVPLVNRGGVSAYSNTLDGIWMNDWDSELWNIGEWSRK